MAGANIRRIRVSLQLVRLFLILLSACSAEAWSTSSPSCTQDARVKDCLCRFVHRKRHHFRHWRWSGIFPVEGGFIPDPHYLCSEDGIFPKPVNDMISAEGSRYAIVDVNPFFDDRSSEVLLLLRWHDEVFEYSLTFPKHKDVRAILAQPTPPPAMVFPYKTGLAVLVNFSGPARGVYVLPLPPRNTALQLVAFGTPEFAEIASAFGPIAQDRSIKNQFCKATNDFVAFYEKYAGPCTEHIKATPEIERRFARFWQSN